MLSGGYTLRFDVDCAPQNLQECALEREIAVHLARQQVLAGGALALLGLAITIRIRGDRGRLSCKGTDQP